MKLLPSLFSCVYSRLKLLVFATNSRRLYSSSVCFIYGLDEKNSKSEVIFAVCRLPLTSCLTSLTVLIHSWTRAFNLNSVISFFKRLQNGFFRIPRTDFFVPPWQNVPQLYLRIRNYARHVGRAYPLFSSYLNGSSYVRWQLDNRLD